MWIVGIHAPFVLIWRVKSKWNLPVLYNRYLGFKGDKPVVRFYDKLIYVRLQLHVMGKIKTWYKLSLPWQLFTWPLSSFVCQSTRVVCRLSSHKIVESCFHGNFTWRWLKEFCCRDISMATCSTKSRYHDNLTSTNRRL